MTIRYSKSIVLDEEKLDCIPTYLADHAELYSESPKDANYEWLNVAHYGLSVNYGLPSLIGQGDDALFKRKVTLDSYTKLKNNFSAEHFDAVDLVQFAVANGMRYIDFNARGEDGFCLFNTKTTDFSSPNSPCRRDLLGELATVCECEGVGLGITYTLGRHLTHPHGPESMQPAEHVSYDEYFNFAANQLYELLTQYGPIATLSLECLDNMHTMTADDFDSKAFYYTLHSMQPQTLISFQEGLTGEEDFFRAHESLPMEDGCKGFVHTQLNKPVQMRRCMTPGYLSYAPQHSGRHLNQTQVWQALETAENERHNLLLNTALMPDGSLDLEDMNTLLAVGERIEKNGFPLRK